MARTQVHGSVAITGVPAVVAVPLRDANGNVVTIGANDRFHCQVVNMSYDHSAGSGFVRLFIGDDDTATADEIVMSIAAATLGVSDSLKPNFIGAKGKTPRFEIELTVTDATCNITGDVVTP